MDLPSHIHWHSYQDEHGLAQGLGIMLESAIEESLAIHSPALIALSGGSTPRTFLKYLCHQELPWQDIVWTPVDERFVPVDHQDSNEKMFRELLIECHPETHFLSMIQHQDLDQSVQLYQRRFRTYGKTYDVCILGMGNDGHTASLFPDAPELAQAIKKDADCFMAMHPQSAAQARISAGLETIMQSKVRILHIQGEEKKRTFTKALAVTNPAEMPIRWVCEQPLHVFWCP